jgi:hypothetical protein
MYFTKDDIITTDKYLNAFSNDYYQTDVIIHKSSINWRNKILYPPNKNMNILITGHSDYSISDNEANYFSPKIWYTVNKQSKYTNIYSIPLGITNNTNESEIHPIYGDLDCMIKVMNEEINYKNLVYMNFNINTYPKERQIVWDLFKNNEWVTIGNIVNTIEGRTNFLREIKSHRFVLCPRGNGVDTHRLWETLYMGSIPIVKKDIGYEEFYDLPICFIDDWNQINEDFLEKEKIRINNTNYCLDKLKISFWIDKIKKSIDNIN